MADAVTSQTLQDGVKYAVMHFTNVSDGTGESAVTKVDVSTLTARKDGKIPTAVAIEKIIYICSGMVVRVLWDATADVVATTLDGYGTQDFSTTGPLVNNSGAGKTGDIQFTTVGHSSGDSYAITMKLRKSYD